MQNKASIIFSPGGLYGNSFLVHGTVSTISDSPVSIILCKDFSKHLTKGFFKSGKYLIGKEAQGLSETLRLITISVKQAVEYDLRLK